MSSVADVDHEILIFDFAKQIVRAYARPTKVATLNTYWDFIYSYRETFDLFKKNTYFIYRMKIINN